MTQKAEGNLVDSTAGYILSHTSMHLVIRTRQIALAVVLPASVAIANTLSPSHASPSRSFILFPNCLPLLVLILYC